MLILTPKDVEQCGVKRPGEGAVLGFRFKQWAFTFESSLYATLDEALRTCREWLDTPQDEKANPEEMRVIYVAPEGCRFGVGSPLYEAKSMDQTLIALCQDMRTESGLVGDHRWRLRTFENSFVGSEAVTWIANRLQIRREEAVRLGQECVRRGYFTHVLSEQDFADAEYFYRFTEDGLPEERILPPSLKID